MSFKSEVQKELIEINSQLEEFRHEIRFLKRQLYLVKRSTTAPDPIRKPKGVNAMSNIAGCLRREIDRLNQNRGNDQAYEQLQHDDSSSNRELKTVMGNILRSKLPEMYGKHTWYHACRSKYASACEEVISKACEMREFYVLTQTANMWAIRLIADSKMRTALRDAKMDEGNVITSPVPGQEIGNRTAQNSSLQQISQAASRAGETTTSIPSENVRDVVLGHVASHDGIGIDVTIPVQEQATTSHLQNNDLRLLSESNDHLSDAEIPQARPPNNPGGLLPQPSSVHFLRNSGMRRGIGAHVIRGRIHRRRTRAQSNTDSS